MEPNPPLPPVRETAAEDSTRDKMVNDGAAPSEFHLVSPVSSRRHQRMMSVSNFETNEKPHRSTKSLPFFGADMLQAINEGRPEGVLSTVPVLKIPGLDVPSPAATPYMETLATESAAAPAPIQQLDEWKPRQQPVTSDEDDGHLAETEDNDEEDPEEEVSESTEQMTNTAAMLQSLSSLSSTPAVPTPKRALQSRIGQRVNLLVLIKVLLQYLEKVEPSLLQSAKLIIAQCNARHKAGDPLFRSLATSMQTNLRELVGEYHWNKVDQIHRQAQFRVRRKMTWSDRNYSKPCDRGRKVRKRNDRPKSRPKCLVPPDVVKSSSQTPLSDDGEYAALSSDNFTTDDETDAVRPCKGRRRLQRSKKHHDTMSGLPPFTFLRDAQQVKAKHLEKADNNGDGVPVLITMIPEEEELQHLSVGMNAMLLLVSRQDPSVKERFLVKIVQRNCSPSNELSKQADKVIFWGRVLSPNLKEFDLPMGAPILFLARHVLRLEEKSKEAIAFKLGQRSSSPPVDVQPSVVASD